MRWLDSWERLIQYTTLCKLISKRILASPSFALGTPLVIASLKERVELLPEWRERCISVHNHCYSTVLHRHPSHFLQGPILPHVFSFELFHFIGEVGPEDLAKAVHQLLHLLQSQFPFST